MSKPGPAAPTHTGEMSGRDRSTGMAWAFESPDEHWRHHDARQMDYWRTRPASERLAQAASYRWRRDGAVAEPAEWTWRFLPPNDP